MFDNIYEVIGNTPMIKLNKLREAGEGDVLAKLEFLNPSSSIKDRAANYMILDAEERGILKPGGTIVEPTSGNMGVALAMIGASKGYNVILTMPESMSIERRKLIKAYGAKIVLTDSSKGMAGSVEKAKQLAEDNNYFMPYQFSNQSNRRAHYETTGKEIIEDTHGEIDAFVAGVGTGGTLSGVAKKLKEYNGKIKIYAVEPETSQVLAGKKAGPHKIQGIGANFIPEIYDESLVDEVISISNEEAYKYSRLLSEKEGILVGISAGANVAAAKKIAKKLGENSKVVTVLPDTGERYLSTDLYSGE